MDRSEDDSETSSGGPGEVDRWQALRDATWHALATAEYPPDATPWAEIPPFEQDLMVGLKMVHENEDFRREVAKRIS